MQSQKKKKKTGEIQLDEPEKGHFGYQIKVELEQNSGDRGSGSDSPECKSRV